MSIRDNRRAVELAKYRLLVDYNIKVKSGAEVIKHIEAITNNLCPEDKYDYLMDFAKREAMITPRTFKPLTVSQQMKDAIKRAEYQPKLYAMTSKVKGYENK